ncbi:MULTISPECIES: DUF3300 domain-containing protein [unclassified Rhizobium]|uniref:DUF3300 domain-containing protein n=1 Tax=unclassified Rhizobium TaxID=2613769 RepID=UPI001ADAA21D|nr:MULTISPECIES: DUF3300 domain-containing protein [unclassified Rhizobium]MBO9123960.1 DUF3300 domain-containing protein [Rhizobium sp. 16-488-2b]MBO9174492.1 DUF3300 domain-containing protein [Rhizobium sp. 16-488-2a]
MALRSLGVPGRWAILVLASTFLTVGASAFHAQEQPTSAPASAPAPASATDTLTDAEMQVLVARIALYPDELVALVTSASLYPLQIVEASRFLGEVKSNTSLKPKDDWDGSVVSLLNYPDIVKMMSDDLDWTQQLGDAVADQQKDLLIAIQTLRDKAVADGIIKTDGKVKVVQQNDNVVIQAANPEKIYVPQYEPQMLYDDGYAPAPIGYYPDPYPNYYYPTATYFAGFVTGAIFGAVVDWDRWGVWGGRFDGNDIDIDCDHCFNRFDRNGKVNFNDVDWKNVDRSKIKFDHNQFANIDKTNIRNRLEAGGNNDIRTKAKSVKARAANANHARITPSAIKDIRANKMAGGGGDLRDRAVNRPAGDRRGVIGERGNRDIGNHAMAGKRDVRPNRPSGLGEVRSRSAANLHSQRGGRAMGGGHHASRPEFAAHRGGGDGGPHFSGGGRGGGGAHFSGGSRGGGGHARVPHGGRRR